MFYSQTFLGRNGPLSKVWCAAHLQHRLKKSDCTSVNIPKTVGYIMYPEVPIALRMSGHLLLGVVRIYSKKVDYLFKDCNFVLTRLSKLFIAEDINLPEDARQAPPEAITLTLPDTFELDAIDVDLNYIDTFEDNHLRTREEITLEDQIPKEGDAFIAVTFDEDCWGSPLVPGTGSQSMERDGLISPIQSQLIPEEGIRSVEQNEPYSPNHGDDAPSGGTIQGQNESHQERELSAVATYAAPEDSSPQSLPEAEKMRDAANETMVENLSSLLPQKDNAAGLMGTEELINDKETTFPSENISTPGEPLTPVQQRSDPGSSAPSRETNDVPDAPVSFEHASPALGIRSSPVDFVIQPSPQIQGPQPQNRRRKRRQQFFDESIVLTNRLMRKALDDPSGILRKRKPRPSSDLGMWKLNKTLRREQVFYEPLITGMCKDVGDIFQQDYTIKVRLAPDAEVTVSVAETLLDDGSEQSPNRAPSTDMEIEQSEFTNNTVAVTGDIPDNGSVQSPSQAMSFDMEIEHMMDNDNNSQRNVFPPELIPSDPSTMHSGSKISDFTPFSENLSPVTELLDRTVTTAGTTPDPAVSTGPYGSDIETPRAFSEEWFRGENARLPDIPEMSALEEDLDFLLINEDSPAASSGSQNKDKLTERARATAQYLQSPTAQVFAEQPGNLSLNKILEGRTQRLCARMFYEITVLKTFGHVEVQQDEPFGDISLRLTGRKLR